jgi:hypothetical protein
MLSSVGKDFIHGGFLLGYLPVQGRSPIERPALPSQFPSPRAFGDDRSRSVRGFHCRNIGSGEDVLKHET